MITSLVWILVVTFYGDSGYNTKDFPPVADLASCQRLQQALPKYNAEADPSYRFVWSQCVQVNLVLTK